MNSSCYCFDNKTALGYGGWFFGQKGKPSFHIGGRPLRQSTESFKTASILNVIPYANPQANLSIAHFFKQQDIDMHNRKKWVAGYQFGGWPENILQSSGSMQRQAGQSCQQEEVWVNAKDQPYHPWAKPDGDPSIGEAVQGDKHNIYGQGFEHWNAGCIPTYVKMTFRGKIFIPVI